MDTQVLCIDTQVSDWLLWVDIDGERHRDAGGPVDGKRLAIVVPVIRVGGATGDEPLDLLGEGAHLRLLSERGLQVVDAVALIAAARAVEEATERSTMWQ